MRKQLAFIDSESPDRVDSFVVDVDGCNRRHLCADGLPRWSPAGDRILVLRASEESLITLASDGTDERLLASGAYWGHWSPDGQRVAFGRDGEVFVIDADGSNERALSRTPSRP